SAVIALAALIIVVGVSVTVKVAQPAEQYSFWPALLVAWIVAMAAYALAWSEPSTMLARARELVGAHRLESFGVVLLVVGALAFRGVALGDLPRAVGGDDGQASLVARRILHGQIASPFSAPTYGLAQNPAPWFYAQAAGMWLVGDDVAGSRTFSAF